jgi:hypothetical protein
LWLLEQVFQPPRFAFGIGFPSDMSGQNSFYHARNLQDSAVGLHLLQRDKPLQHDFLELAA